MYTVVNRRVNQRCGHERKRAKGGSQLANLRNLDFAQLSVASYLAWRRSFRQSVKGGRLRLRACPTHPSGRRPTPLLPPCSKPSMTLSGSILPSGPGQHVWRPGCGKQVTGHNARYLSRSTVRCSTQYVRYGLWFHRGRHNSVLSRVSRDLSRCGKRASGRASGPGRGRPAARRGP